MVYRRAHNIVGGVLLALLIIGVGTVLFQGCSNLAPVGQAFEYGDDCVDCKSDVGTVESGYSRVRVCNSNSDCAGRTHCGLLDQNLGPARYTDFECRSFQANGPRTCLVRSPSVYAELCPYGCESGACKSAPVVTTPQLPAPVDPDYCLGSQFGTPNVFTGARNTAIVIPSSEKFNFGSGGWTISMWVKPEWVNAWHALVVKRQTHEVMNDWGLWYNSAGVLKLIYGVNSQVDLSPAPSANEWSHIVLTRTANRLHYYINGVEQGSGSDLTDSLGFTNMNVLIGGGNNPTGSHEFKGEMGGVYISKQGATHANVVALFNKGKRTTLCAQQSPPQSPVQDGDICSSSIGVYGEQKNFDGVDDKIEVASTPALNFKNNDWAISFSITPEWVNTWHALVVKREDHVKNNEWGLWYNNGGKLKLIFAKNVPVDLADAPDNGKQTNVVVTRNNGKLETYYNGVKKSSKSFSTSLPVTSQKILIGAGNEGGSHYYKGDMSAVTIFNRGLTASEAKEIHDGKSCSSQQSQTSEQFTFRSDRTQTVSGKLGTITVWKLAQLIKDQAPRAGCTYFYQPDGTYYWVQSSGDVLYDAQSRQIAGAGYDNSPTLSQSIKPVCSDTVSDIRITVP